MKGIFVQLLNVVAVRNVEKGEAALLALLLLLAVVVSSTSLPAERENTIFISGSTTVYPLASLWAEKYMEENPQVRVDVIGGGSGKGISDVSMGLVDIGMSSRDLKDRELQLHPSLKLITIAHDAVIVVVNSHNPLLDVLLERGISRVDLRNVYVVGNVTNWEYLARMDFNGDGWIAINETHAMDLSGAIRKPDGGYTYPLNLEIHVYTRSDASGTGETFAKFLGVHQERLLGSGQSGNLGVLSAVGGDELGIGYVSLAYAFDESVVPIPVDGDCDGVISEGEAVHSYEYVAEHIDLYPIARNLYFVVNVEALSDIAKDFILWCVDEGGGQQFVELAGYVPISSSEHAEVIELLSDG